MSLELKYKIKVKIMKQVPTVTLDILNRDIRLSLPELKEFIITAASKGEGIYKVIINNTNELCKWGISNSEETTIVIKNIEHDTLGDITAFSAYVDNAYIKGRIEYYDWGDIGIFPQINNIDPFTRNQY